MNDLMTSSGFSGEHSGDVWDLESSNSQSLWGLTLAGNMLILISARRWKMISSEIPLALASSLNGRFSIKSSSSTNLPVFHLPCGGVREPLAVGKSSKRLVNGSGSFKALSFSSIRSGTNSNSSEGGDGISVTPSGLSVFWSMSDISSCYYYYYSYHTGSG